MEVSSVSFAGRLAQTKKGNTYEKTNTGKRIGTVVGLAGGGIAARTDIVQFCSAVTASRFLKGGKAVAATYGILGAIVAAATLAGRALGTIPDTIINSKRKAQADKIAADNTKS